MQPRSGHVPRRWNVWAEAAEARAATATNVLDSILLELGRGQLVTFEQPLGVSGQASRKREQEVKRNPTRSCRGERQGSCVSYTQKKSTASGSYHRTTQGVMARFVPVQGNDE